MLISGANKLITAFVTLIIGALLIASVATESNLKTEKKGIIDENKSISTFRTKAGSNDINTSVSNFTVTNNPTSWKQAQCPLTGVVYGNASTNWVKDTDYILYDNLGVVTVLNTTSTSGSQPNNTLIDYTYCGDDYITQGFGRTGLKTVVGLLAIAVLLVSVGLFYSIGKDYDIF